MRQAETHVVASPPSEAAGSQTVPPAHATADDHVPLGLQVWTSAPLQRVSPGTHVPTHPPFSHA